MELLRISLFGQLKIGGQNEQPLVMEPRRAQELLAYLLLYRDRLHPRERLAALWWGEKSTSQSKRYLRQTLWHVQSTFHQLCDARPNLLCVDYERIGINAQAVYWLDVAVFEQAFATVDQIPGSELTPHQVELLQRALPLYQGELLEGWYHDWCIYERERYLNMYLAILDKLLGYSETHHLYAAGVAYGEQILRYDHAREQTHRQLMRLHHQVGNRTAAIHQYESCVAALRKELDVAPTQSTLALYKEICREQASPPDLAILSNGPDPCAREIQPEDALQQLEQIQLTLAHLQAQVTHLMQALTQKTIRRS
jgi:DNA-binding SARP family transcriptional activator